MVSPHTLFTVIYCSVWMSSGQYKAAQHHKTTEKADRQTEVKLQRSPRYPESSFGKESVSSFNAMQCSGPTGDLSYSQRAY